jgi:hypothetical protein
VGEPQGSPVKYHYFHRLFTDSVRRDVSRKKDTLLALIEGSRCRGWSERSGLPCREQALKTPSEDIVRRGV